MTICTQATDVSCIAEEEGRRISERTVAALASAEARGVELGQNGKVHAICHRQQPDRFAMEHGPKIVQFRSNGSIALRAIASHLNEAQVISGPHGG